MSSGKRKDDIDEELELMRTLYKNMRNYHKTWSDMDVYKGMVKAYRSTMLGNFLG